jgi:hypothetical protein
MLQSLRTVVTSLAIASVIGTVAQAYASSSTQAMTGRAQISTAGVSIQAVDYVSSGDMQWITCTNRAGAVRCETPNFPASAVEKLEVSAA